MADKNHSEAESNLESNPERNPESNPESNLVPSVERRGSSRGGRRPQPTANSPGTVAVDALPALVLKHSQRFCKDGRPFSLAALDILEYEQVLKVFGVTAAEQLDRLGRLVCTNALRGTDRLCFVEPGHILILLPDTDRACAKAVLERITQSIASARLHYKNKPLRASGAFQVVSCDTVSDTTGMLPPDLDALLQSIGYKIDEQGNLYSSQSASLRLLSKKPRPFSGSFSVWSDRYVNIQSVKAAPKMGSLSLPGGLIFMRAVAFDQWQAGKLVNLKLFEIAENKTRFDAESLSMVARRARVLQQIDHPGVAKLLDFHAFEERSLYLVENPIEGKKLAALTFNLETAIEWSIQICNTLIYLQGLIPPLIPPPLHQENFVVLPDNQLVLLDYEVPYLLTPLMVIEDGQDGVNVERLSAPHNRFGMENLFTFIYDLIARAKDDNADWRRLLREEEGFEKFNSIFKLRSSLKKIYDKLKAGAAR